MHSLDTSQLTYEVIKYLHENNIKLVMKLTEDGGEIYTELK